MADDQGEQVSTHDARLSLRHMARGNIVERLQDDLANEYGWTDPDDYANARETAELVVDFLTADASLWPSERWDEDCHVCEKRIGNHTVEGKCPF